jgi:hypothetical protein
MVGFDSVKPSAMEMFRSHVEECKWLLESGPCLLCVF